MSAFLIPAFFTYVLKPLAWFCFPLIKVYQTHRYVNKWYSPQHWYTLDFLFLLKNMFYGLYLVFSLLVSKLNVLRQDLNCQRQHWPRFGSWPTCSLFAACWLALGSSWPVTTCPVEDFSLDKGWGSGVCHQFPWKVNIHSVQPACLI